MNYCPNCGSMKEENSKVCRYCGYIFEKLDINSDKDRRIRELEMKIERLEKEQKPKSQSFQSDTSPWVFIMPIAFVAIFFLFVFMIVFITR